MNKVELLVPVGDFDCLKAAVQNGADAVYLGSSEFNARSSATNFDLKELERAINYAHLRNIKVHLTLNTLIKNNEFETAVFLANKAYELGIDAIIVQDLGLANFLINNFPTLPIHASTQMTCHNLDSALYLEKAGFKRIVLARELSMQEIEHIKSNVSCEIEVFVHGALCISYSGQCLYSSLIGGRSGNRGKCAQGCRLPYELLENSNTIDKGYLLSPKDICSLEILPKLLNTNINSLKIEGRMKSPEYVATATRIYRKYLNKIYNNETYMVEEQDLKDLLQVFNRGNFSTGHLENKPNHNLIFKEKPNNMGIYIGTVIKYNSNKGYITLKSEDTLNIGDCISLEKESCKYTISELMIQNKNIAQVNPGQLITIGRMKGNISVGDKIYKISSKTLSDKSLLSYTQEYIKTPLSCVLDLHLDSPITLRVFDNSGIEFTIFSEETPEVAINSPITEDRIKTQLNKTKDTPFYFKNIKINMDANLYIPHISTINELRRLAIEKYSNIILDKNRKNSLLSFKDLNTQTLIHNDNKIALLLNKLNLSFDYSKLEKTDKIYIPLKYFSLKEYSNIIKYLSSKTNLYIYMPTIIKSNYRNLFNNLIEDILTTYSIKGFVLSNVGCLELLEKYRNKYEFIANYTFNIFNNHTINNLNCDVYTISPEINKDEINVLSSNTNKKTELIVYGKLPLMNMGYCLLGNSNKCYPECSQKCKSNNNYYLKDRMNFLFQIEPDNIQTITTIYNSKINSIDTHDINIDNLRIDILDENIDEINEIINTVKSRNKLEGKYYTNGNLNRIV